MKVDSAVAIQSQRGSNSSLRSVQLAGLIQVMCFQMLYVRLKG